MKKKRLLQNEAAFFGLYYLRILLFTLLFFFTLSYTQVPGLINYNEKDGLNASYTYTLRQDKNGFIWIGSSNGLFRFDGSEFKRYSGEDGLNNIDILEGMPLPNGEIFIIPFLNDFASLKAGQITNSAMNSQLRKIRFTSGSPWIQSYKNKILLCNNHNPRSIYFYENGKTTEIPIFIREYFESGATILNFDFNSEILYLQIGRSIIAYHLFTGKKNNLYADLTADEKIIFSKENLYISKKGNKLKVYIKSESSLHKIGSYKSPDAIHHISIDQFNRLWVALENGGLLYFKKNLYDPSSLQLPVKFLHSYFINSVLIDQDQNIWISTRHDGVFFINAASFRSFLNSPLHDNVSDITSIASNSKNIFLGYNSLGGAVYNGRGLRPIQFTGSNKLENRAIYANDNAAYFGHATNFYEYNVAQNKIITYGFFSGIKNIIPYSKNEILICSHKSLEKYNMISHHRVIIWNERTYTALPFTSDSIFAGTFKDLYKIDLDTKKSQLFLEGYYFSDIKKLKNNLYAGATNGKGIILFNNEKIVKNITEKDGLTDNQIKRIDVQNRHIIWASTNSGLVRINLKNIKKPEINIFTFADGIPSNKIAGCIIRDDSIFIGTSKGLGIFPLKKLIQQSYIHKKVIINSVTVGGKEYFDYYKRSLVAKSPQNNVVFNLSFLDYSSQGEISYRYRIEGLNTGWETTSAAKIVLMSLPPGKYVFMVYGLGYNGKRSLIATRLSFVIEPQFWQTLWFKILIVSAGLIFSFIIFSVYTRRKRSQKLNDLYTEKKMAELKLQAIKAQINPHFIYNCLNSIKFLLYKKDIVKAENYLQVFSQMIRKTLIYSEKTFMPINEEIEYLTLYLEMEQLRLKEKFSYKVTVSKDVNLQWLIPSLLVQPFVENALKHGISNLSDRKGNINISFEYTDPDLSITVKDNGVGFKDKSVFTEKTDSFGIKLCRKRMDTFKQLFNTKITMETNDLSETKQKPGTEIKLIISYEHTNPNLHY